LPQRSNSLAWNAANSCYRWLFNDWAAQRHVAGGISSAVAGVATAQSYSSWLFRVSLSRLTDYRKSETKSRCGPDFRDKKLQRASPSQWVRSLEPGRAQ
jgi:hypothetical protein